MANTFIEQIRGEHPARAGRRGCGGTAPERAGARSGNLAVARGTLRLRATVLAARPPQVLRRLLSMRAAHHERV